jgi:hypothetical protein
MPIILWAKKMVSTNPQNEIEQERVSYLLNVDDIIYTMLSEPLITRYKSDMPANISNIGAFQQAATLEDEIAESSY